MIRKFAAGDLDQVMRLWLDTNLSAHAFIPRSYWEEKYAAVKVAIPQARVLVFEEQGEIKGFLGLSEQDVQGLFVKKSCQGRGIGKALLASASKSRPRLRLQVYEKNSRAVGFYQREGFRLVKKQIDEGTGELEWVMEWNR